MATISNPVLAQKVSDLLDLWRARELEMRAWMSGAADGGPYGDGRFPLTDYLGVVRYTYSPAALEEGVASSATAASTSATEAAASLADSLAAQAAAEVARDSSAGYRDAAQAAQVLAETYKNQSAASAASALSYKNAAATSASAAAGSASDAQDSATAAAAASDDSAGASATAAASAAAAAASAAAAATFDPDNFYTKTAADARYRQLSVAIVSSDITSLAWSKLTSVPSTFTPSSHTHGDADITALAWSKLTGVPSTFAPDVTATFTWSGTHTFNGTVEHSTTTRIAGAGNFQLKPGASDHVYMGFYARTASPTARSGYMGFASAATNHFTLANEISGGDLNLNTAGAGTVKVNGTLVSLAGHAHAASDITSGVLNVARLGSGTANSGRFLRGDGSWTDTLLARLEITAGASESLRLNNDAAYLSFYNTAGSTRTGYLQMQAGSAVYLVSESTAPIHLRVNGATVLSAQTTSPLITIAAPNSGPWALGLYRSDYATSSKVFNNKYDGTNPGWAFEDMPYVKGIRDYGGGAAALQTPNTTGVNYRWDLIGNGSSACALRLADSSNTGQMWVYANSGDFGILNGSGDWRYKITSGGAHLAYSGSTYYVKHSSDASYAYLETNSVKYYIDKPVHVDGETFRYSKGAHLYYDSSSNVTGKITVSTSAASGTPAEGELWFQRAA